jgi:hypothetical protein
MAMFKRLRGLFSRPPKQEKPVEEPQVIQEAAIPDLPLPQASEVSSFDEALTYLDRVQEKISRLAEEFADGSINRSQFNELYDHYRREQITVKQLIDLYPESDAWKEATTEGKSVIIRTEHTAKVVGYAVYENESGMPLNTIGQFEVEAELAIPMLSSYRAATKEIFGAGMRSSQIEGGRWLCYMPGEFTTLMALFSTEPAVTQLEAMENLHRLFERANRTLLAQQVVDPNELVFPHTYFLGRLR